MSKWIFEQGFAIRPKTKEELETEEDKQEYTMFDILRGRIHKSYNCNYHYDALDSNTQVWVKEMCKLIEKMIKEKE